MEIFRKIKAMNTVVELFIISNNKKKTEEIIDLIENYIVRFENRFSRFITSSELSRLNGWDNEKFSPSEEMFELISLSKDFYKKTGGIFDPTVASALDELGYNKSFELLKNGGDCKKPTIHTKLVSFTELKIDKKNYLISKPKNIKIDFGGIGKGYLVDKINKFLSKKGYNNFWISAGGDIFLSGNDTGGDIWKVGAQNPTKHSRDLLKIKCLSGKTAIATSGITKRMWGNKKDNLHHIIDPRTSLPVKNNLLSATVISDNTVSVDVFAKTSLILGEKKGIEFINKEKNTECVLIDNKLNMILSKNMNEYLC